MTSQGLTKCQMTFLHLGQHIKGPREYHTQSQTHTHTHAQTHTRADLIVEDIPAQQLMHVY